MIKLEPRTARECPTVARLHPTLYQEVRYLAVSAGVTYTKMLENIVQAGIEAIKSGAKEAA